MGFMTGLSSMLGKSSDYTSEYKKFKKAIERNPGDLGLKSEFIKFCLLNRFTEHEAVEEHIAEVLRLYESVSGAESLDLQCHYLVGKYYQEAKDLRKAYQIYLNAIKRFNHHVQKSPSFKADNGELAYSLALNLMALQWDPVDPEVEVCFKIIKKSYPLHLKRVEFENEMAKPAPNPARIKKLTEEIRKFKEEEDKAVESPVEAKTPPEAASTATETAQAAPATIAPAPAVPAPASAPAPLKEEVRQSGIFSKMFTELSPGALGLVNNPGTEIHSGSNGKDKSAKGDKVLTPFSQSFVVQGAAFLAFHDNHWEGPFTPVQFRSLGTLKPATWVCRVGSQQVLQAYEVPELQPLFARSF
jgi:hypothetical protein